MTVALRKYFWTFNLLAIALGAYFLASILIDVLVVAKLPVPRPLARRTLARSGANTSRNADVTPILERNIFCSACEPAKPVEPATTGGATSAATAGAPVAGGPVKSTLAHKLLATLVSEADKAWSFAILLDPQDEKSRMYAIGQQLSGGEATVVDVLPRRVLLQRENRSEYIELDSDANKPASPHRPPVASSFTPPKANSAFGRFTSDIAAGVRQTGPNQWELQRSALNKVLGNTTMLARSARIVPSVRNGKPDGFKLYAIRPGSVYSLIGMQNGDTIHAINGHAITTPDKALAVYTQVRTASHLSISFSRRGQAKTNDYTIR